MAARISDETMAIAIKDAKGNLSLAAERLGCERATIYDRIRTSDMLKQARAEAQESRCDMYESLLDQKAQSGDINAIKFYLATQGKRRGYTEKQEVEVNGGLTINIGVEYNDV